MDETITSISKDVTHSVSAVQTPVQLIAFIAMLLFIVVAMAMWMWWSDRKTKMAIDKDTENRSAKRDLEQVKQDHRMNIFELKQEYHMKEHENYGASHKELRGKVLHIEKTMVTKDEFQKTSECVHEIDRKLAIFLSQHNH